MKAPLRRKASGTPVIDLHILITRDPQSGYDAVCLEMGLATSGPDLEELKADMLRLIVAHVRGCIEEGRPQDILVPAAPEHWKVYMEAVASETCMGSAVVPFPRELLEGEDERVARYTKNLAAQSLVCDRVAA